MQNIMAVSEFPDNEGYKILVSFESRNGICCYELLNRESLIELNFWITFESWNRDLLIAAASDTIFLQAVSLLLFLVIVSL